MRNQLFKCEITRADRLVIAFVVAHDESRASEIIFQTEIENNRENLAFILERVDHDLPPDRCKRLGTLLESGVVGLASYNEVLGWVAHSIPTPRLHFYRIKEVDGDSYSIIAPTSDVASDLYCEICTLKDDKPQLFRIFDGFYDLKPNEMRGLPTLLEVGPVGLIKWDDQLGWTTG